MTITDFADRILRPIVLANLRAGKLDVALSDPDVWEIVEDEEVRRAMKERLAELQSQGSPAMTTTPKAGD